MRVISPWTVVFIFIRKAGEKYLRKRHEIKWVLQYVSKSLNVYYIDPNPFLTMMPAESPKVKKKQIVNKQTNSSSQDPAMNHFDSK